MDTSKLDAVLGIIALLIVIGGLIMLFSGVNNMND
nr:NAD synthetase [Cyanobacterium sp. IPPAS B-1200]